MDTKLPQDQLADIKVSAIDPTVNDDASLRYGVGSKWFNSTSTAFFICEDATAGAAIWTQTAGTGGSPGGGSQLFLQTTQQTANAGAGEITMATTSIPGGTLGTNNAIRIKIQRISPGNSNNSSCVFKVKYGGTTVFTDTASQTTNVQVGTGFIEVIIAGDGATNAQITDGQLVHGTGPAAGTTETQGIASVVSSAVNSAVSQTLEITADATAQAWTTGIIIVEKVNSGGTGGTYFSYVFQQAGNDATATVIPHGFGTTPSRIKVTAMGAVGAGAASSFESTGVYDGTNVNTIYYYNAAGTGFPTSVIDTTNIIRLVWADPSHIVAVPVLDSTNITLNWTITGGGTGVNQSYLVEAWI